MRKYVIAIYIRLSLEDSKTESLSIFNQRLALRRHAEILSETENSEIEILEFVDNGYSGTNFERPAVQELLELVRSYGIDCIIVKDFSRFGRNSIETGYFIERVFPLYRVRFISVYDRMADPIFFGFLIFFHPSATSFSESPLSVFGIFLTNFTYSLSSHLLKHTGNTALLQDVSFHR